MSQDGEIEGPSPQWKNSTVTINAKNCHISFFQPVLQTSDHSLPSLEYDVKTEDPDYVLQDHTTDRPMLEDAVDLIPFPEPKAGRLSQNESISVHTHASQPTYLEQEFDETPSINSEEMGVESTFGEEDLVTLYDDFNVRHDVTSGTAVMISQQTEESPSTNYVLPMSSLDISGLDGTDSHNRHGQIAVVRGPSVARFFCQHDEKLPRKKRHGSAHNWSFAEREALCLPFQFYNYASIDDGSKKISRVLTEYFRQTSDPHQGSFRGNQIKAQWIEWSPVFEKSRKRPDYNPRATWMEKRAKLEAAASRAGVRLDARTQMPSFKKCKQKSSLKMDEKIKRNQAWFLSELKRTKENQALTFPSPQASPLASRSSASQSSLLQQLLDAIPSEEPSTLPGQESPPQAAQTQQAQQAQQASQAQEAQRTQQAQQVQPALSNPHPHAPKPRQRLPSLSYTGCTTKPATDSTRQPSSSPGDSTSKAKAAPGLLQT